MPPAASWRQSGLGSGARVLWVPGGGGTTCWLSASRTLPRGPAWPGLQAVRYLHGLLTEAGYRAVMLHGERTQYEREAAIKEFRGGKSQVREEGGRRAYAGGEEGALCSHT